MDDEEEPAQNPVCRQGMRERRTYLRRPFQPQEGACHHAAGRIIFERRRVTGSISRRGTYLHGTHGVLQERCFPVGERKSTRLNSSHVSISYAVFCLKKKTPLY